ncbi:MAG: peptidoglycan editing factor PgeF [Candidatus Electrothrix sp. EH2]|nr:peptidoglycan editing factor PgeF [Candidatus Electrothrix sp. EH2]
MLYSVSHLLYYTAPLISTPHAIFTRQGGVSESPFSSLNLSFAVGDDPAAVRKNRDKVKKELKVQYLASAVQVHGEHIAVVKELTEDREYQDADALITNQKGAGLLIQQADCQAVLLHDPQREVIAAVHCGWRGSTANIIAKTIRAMQKHFNTLPENLHAVISPSLGPCCAEFVHYENELPASFRQWRIRDNHFDFWKISRHHLQTAGLPTSHIRATEICTVCNKDFFSFRRTGKKQRGSGVTGRNGSVIALETE